MKYKDLIEKLLPFAEEEVNIVASREEKYIYPSDIPYNEKQMIVAKVLFYDNTEEGNFITGIMQEFDAETYENENTEFLEY